MKSTMKENIESLGSIVGRYYINLSRVVNLRNITVT